MLLRLPAIISMKEEDAGVQIAYEWLVTMGDESKAMKARRMETNTMTL